MRLPHHDGSRRCVTPYSSRGRKTSTAPAAWRRPSVSRLVLAPTVGANFSSRSWLRTAVRPRCCPAALYALCGTARTFRTLRIRLRPRSRGTRERGPSGHSLGLGPYGSTTEIGSWPLRNEPSSRRIADVRAARASRNLQIGRAARVPPSALGYSTPCSASHLSQSRAAMQPVPAALTAWR